MSIFHKPKTYRSMQGCCICRTKSARSKFTDSKRYEADFIKCFGIIERRSGEICNSCIHVVKRWKKLPAGSNTNWHHVVDARAGPGTKSMHKIKHEAKMEEKLLKTKYKHKKSQVKKSSSAAACTSGGLSDDVADHYSDRTSQLGDNLSNSHRSDDKGSSRSTRKRRKAANPVQYKRREAANPSQYSSFLGLNYWKRTEVCCGVIFKGPRGDVAIDMSLMHPCTKCKQLTKDSMVSAPRQEVLSKTAESPMVKEDDDDEMNDADSNDILDGDDEDVIMIEIDLDEEMINYNLDGLDDDEGTDFGLGSQEISTAEASPQTAEAILHAMSAGAK